MKKNEIQKFLKIAIEAAKTSGKIQKQGFEKKHSIQFKDTINLVTEVDKACEDKIVKILKKNFPSHSILAEESGAHGDSKEYVWVIDPLDGTTNYAHGFPAFCTSIALEHKGRSIVGVVYDPMLDQLFWSVRGNGAYLNKKKIHVSKIDQLFKSLLATGFAYNVQKVKNNNVDNFKNFLMRAQAVRRMGAAAIDLCYVACGRFDGFWELQLQPWDTAAAVLILEEAGGRATLFDGSPFDNYRRQIVASNAKIHQEMLDVLKLTNISEKK